MGPIFDPTEDYLSIVGAEEQMGTLAAKRQKELDEANNNLKSKLPPISVTTIQLT